MHNALTFKQKMKVIEKINPNLSQKWRLQLKAVSTEGATMTKDAFTAAVSSAWRASGLKDVADTTISTAQLIAKTTNWLFDAFEGNLDDFITTTISGPQSEEEYLVGGSLIAAPPADSPALNNVFTILRGGGSLPHSSFGKIDETDNIKRDADTSDKWGLTRIMLSSVRDKLLGEDKKPKVEDEAGDNTCLHRITESAAILMKANMPLYMPMIHRFYERQSKVIKEYDSGTRNAEGTMMNTPSWIHSRLISRPL